MDNQESTPGVNTDLPPPYSNVDQEPPSYEDVCPSSGNTNIPPPSYVDTLPPHHVSPLSSVSTDTTVPPVASSESSLSQTQANDGDTPYNGIPLDIIPAATPGVITRESLGRALRRAHQRRIAERRQADERQRIADERQHIAETTPTEPDITDKPDIAWGCTIAALIFCCPVGIVTLIYSIKAEIDFKAGRYEEAKKAAEVSNCYSPLGCGFGAGCCVGILLPASIALPFILFA
ncbi:uncharacterized protein [Dysidea avara]|uniref:uncharacterized protein n=1 Tax=Dysidea avara TaxID=196820 RepID=UPI0033219E94